MDTKKRIIVIPSYEPDSLLIDLLKECADTECDVIVVDDGSGEDYKDIFLVCEQYACVIRHDINKGKGAALKTAFAHIKDNYECDYTVVTIDSDGQHRISDAMKLCDAVNDDSNILILGSRKQNKSSPLRSRFGNFVTKIFFKAATGLSVNDTQTGLRAFSDKLTDYMLGTDGNRYEYEMNVLLGCSEADIDILEIPIETIYIDNNSKSHFNAIKDSFRVYKEILKFCASSLLGFIVDYILYSLLFLFTSNITVSNLFARLVSATVNFLVNRNIVFRSKKSAVVSALQYAALAVCIIIGNTLVLNLLVHVLGVNELLAKLFTEIMFFLISWLVQRFFIFSRKGVRKEK